MWHTGLVAPRHVVSSWTRAQTLVPALAGRFSTTAPPRKSSHSFFSSKYFYAYCVLGSEDTKVKNTGFYAYCVLGSEDTKVKNTGFYAHGTYLLVEHTNEIILIDSTKAPRKK